MSDDLGIEAGALCELIAKEIVEDMNMAAGTKTIVAYVPLLIAVMMVGCSTYVTVSSEPTGAEVYARGKGRAAYRWRQVGTTPVTYNSPYNAEWIRVRWQDSTMSPPRVFELLGKGTLTAHFDSPSLAAALPPERVSERSGTREKSNAQIVLLPLPERRWDPDPVAVADLQSIGLSEGESRTLSENVRYALVDTEYFKVVSRADMELLLHEASFQKSDVCSESQCLVEMGRLLSVSKIVGGTVGMAGGVYNFTLRFVDVETGRVEFSVYRDVEDPKQLLAAVRTLGEDLARKYAEKREME